MSDFRISPLQFNTVSYVYGERDDILIDPEYQRASDVWSLEKRQLLIDSILNNFDIPKLYFHEFVVPAEKDGHTYKYAIIDGKQRLQSIWGFMNGDFALGQDFEYIHDRTVQAAGMSYRDLVQNYPKLSRRFDASNLPIVLIQTEDLELIEDMFSRLNEAVPLNAPEKRNAFGGPLPKAIREVAREPFFTTKLPFGNSRYRHFDLATKFLYIEEKDRFSDTKKVYLDEFVRDYRNRPNEDAEALIESVRKVLSALTPVFVNSDPLLRSVGMSVLYYLLFREAVVLGWSDSITRRTLDEFETLRARNREIAAADIAKADYELLEFDRLSQSLNDEFAVYLRYRVMRRHIGP
jgi:hypothetical protein